MRTILLFASSAIALSGCGGKHTPSVAASPKDVCSGFRVEQDKFGGGTTMSAAVQNLSIFQAVGVAMEVKSGVAELSLIAKSGGAVAATITRGTQVPIRLEDGTIKTLSTARDVATTSYVSNREILTLLPYTLSLDEETLRLLAKSPLTAVRFPLPTGNWDWEPNNYIRKDLMTAAACAQRHVSQRPPVRPATSL